MHPAASRVTDEFAFRSAGQGRREVRRDDGYVPAGLRRGGDGSAHVWDDTEGELVPL